MRCGKAVSLESIILDGPKRMLGCSSKTCNEAVRGDMGLRRIHMNPDSIRIESSFVQSSSRLIRIESESRSHEQLSSCNNGACSTLHMYCHELDGPPRTVYCRNIRSPLVIFGPPCIWP